MYKILLLIILMLALLVACGSVDNSFSDFSFDPTVTTNIYYQNIPQTNKE